MPNNNNRINFQVGYNVDQASVNAVKKSLQDLQNIKLKDFSGTKTQLDLIKLTAGKVESALTKAFNVNLNSLNTQQFNTSLKEAGLSVDKIYTSFSKAGAQGQVAFSRMASEVLTTNMQLKLTNSLVSQMGETMANTIKWGIASSVMNNFTNSVRQAFDYVKALDSSLNDIRIVTKQSSDLMANFAVQANNSAQALGRSTMDYAKAALTFYQQGLDEASVQARTLSVLKAQNITGAGLEMADYLTAVWNGYKVANEEAELYVDKLAAVADSSASNMSLLAIAMSKVASSANLLGVPVDSLNAQIATIVATTRQAPESVGNALKTIYSRINDIVTGADDALISLGNYSAKMALVGVNVLDANGRLRDTGDVIDEIGGKWETLSHEQQIYLARTMAGQRQYNNLLALFENWGKYSDLVNVSMEAQGATALKNAIYMESLGAKMEQLGAAGEKVKAALIDEEDLKGLVDFGTGAVNLFGNLILSIGGGKGALLAFGSIFTQVFSGTIAKELNNTITNIQNIRNNKALLDKDVELTRKFGTSKGYQLSIIDQMVLAKRAAQDYYKFMDAAQINEYNQIVKQIGFRQDEVTLLKEKIDKANLYNLILEKTANKTGNELLDQLDLSVEKSQNLSDTLNTIKGSGLKQVTDYDTFAQITNQVIESKNAIGEGFLDNLFNLFENLSQTLAEKFAEGLSAIRGAKDEFSRFLLLARLFNNESSQRNNFALEQQENEESLKKALAALDLVIQKQLDYLQNIMQFSKVKTFVNMAAGLGQFASGLNNIVNLTKIWKNESLSAGEKLIQTFTNLGMTIPMMVNGFTQAKKGFDLIILQGKIALVAQLMGTKASFKAMVAKQMLAGMDKEAAIAAVQHAIAEQGLSVALKQVAADAWAAIAPLAPFIAVAAAVGVAIYAMYKQWNRLADAAKKAALVAKQTKETYDDLKSSYDNLKSSLENYNSAQEAIQNMTKGTQEWRDVIRESNDAVLDLIQSYPELASAVLNVNGQLILSESVQQEALLKAAAAVDNARLASISTAALSRDASLRANARESGRFAGLITYSGQFIQATTDQIMKVVEAYSTATDRSVLALAKLTGMSEQLVSSILTEVDNMDLLVALLQNNTEATKLSYEAMASERLQDNKVYEGLDDLGKQVALAIAGQDLMAGTDINLFLTTDDSFKQLSKFSSASEDYMQDILDRFRKAMGDATIDWASNAAQGFGGKLLHFMVDGQELLYTKEQVAATIAASEALQDLTGSVEKAKDVLNDIGDISNQSNATALKDFIGNQGFGNLISGQLNELNPYSHEMAVFFNEHALLMGYEGGKAFQDAFILAQQAALKDWDLLGADSLAPVKETINSFFKEKDFSLLTAKNIKIALDNAFKQVGNEGIESLTNLFDDSTLNIDLIIKTISSADITTPEGLQELTEQLQQIGDGSFAASEGWLNFVNQVSLTQFENPLDNIFERQDNINKITKGFNKYSIINDEDYNTLIQINPLIDALFKRVSGGYLLIESKGSLMDLLTGGTNGYIDAANQFDSLKLSAANLALSFGEDFLASLLTQAYIPDAILQSIASINSQLNSELLWSALGFNEDYIEAKKQKFLELFNTIQENRMNGINPTLEQLSELSALLQELKNFLNTAANAPDIFQGITDSLRDAAALDASSLVDLNNMLASGDLGEGAEAMLRYAMAYEKVAEKEALNLDPDIDVDKWKDLSEYFQDYADVLEDVSDLVQDNELAANDIAEAMLRYQNAIDEVVNSYDDWMEALSSDSIVDQVAAGNELQNVYADLLDLPFENLSPDFTQNISNLLLLKQAVYGTEEEATAAYDELQRLAQIDIMTHVGLDPSDFYTLSGALYNQYNTIQNELDDIEVGAFIDNTQALQAMNLIINSADMTALQASDLLASMGIDALVEEKQVPEDQEQAFINAVPSVTYQPVRVPLLIAGRLHTTTTAVPTILYNSDSHSLKATGKKTTTALRVKSARKSSGGGIKVNHSSAPSTPSRSGGGGGGKGSVPKAATQAKVSTAKIETAEKTPDHNPYEQELKSYLRQSKILDELQDQLKKLVNKDRLKNLLAQNKTLKEQEKILNRELKISEDYDSENSTADYARRLRQQFTDALSFDADGQISDVNKLEQRAADIYNEAVKKATDDFAKKQADYNSYINLVWNKYSTQDEQNLNKARKLQMDLFVKDAELKSKKAIKDAEEEYKTREDLINSYTKAWEADQKRLELIKKIQDQIIENQIAASKIKVDFAIDTGDFERDWLDFENKFIKKLDKDDFLGNAKASAKELMSYFNSDQIQETSAKIALLNLHITDMQNGGTSSIYGINLAQAQEDLEDYMKQQMDDLADVQDLIDDIKDNYLDALDNAKDKMDDQIDQYERVNDLIEHNVKLTLMLYGDKAYDTMDKYYELQKANNKDLLESLRMQQQYWQDLMKNLTKNSPAWNLMKKNLDDVTDNLNSKLEKMIENLSDQWLNRVDGIIAKLNNALTGGRGLDYLDEQWDYINTFDDNFLDTFESKMGIQEVTDLYQLAIDGLSGSPANQQKINKLMNEQLKILREKDNLTQYDIDRAKAALEVEKARMALEDARYNKTKMRLRRDSQGNYTYQYVADEEKLGDLQAALANAQANLYNMDKEHYTLNLNTLYDAYKDYIDKMRDLTEEYNNTQDAEERARIQARIDLLRLSTNNLMQGLTEDNKYALQYLNESFFGGMGIDTTLLSADEQMEIMTQNIPQMQSNIQDLANTLVGEGGILNATNGAMKQISDATIEYDKNVKQFLTDTGSSLQVVTNVTDAAGNAFDKNIQQAESLITTNQKLIDKCNAQVDAIQKMLSYLDQFMTKVINVEELITRLRAGYNTGQSLNGSDLTADKLGVASLGLDSTTGMNFTGDFTGNPKTDAAAVKQQFDAIMAQYEKFLTQMSIAAFDTGGSTGSWGDAEGRLAFLHEKELVLNQQDTANILAAVEAVRMITGSLNGLATGEIGSLINNATGLLGGIDNTNTLDQNVHIEANFPNVTQHTEIEQAFNNLVNMASMRASGYRD